MSEKKVTKVKAAKAKSVKKDVKVVPKAKPKKKANS
jgi:hypothetical protein